MDYGRAQDIRKQGLISLLTDKLISGEGVGSSVGSALSERTQATFTGIKEKFDPLNIAKVLSFGSNFAPALLGRMTGRSTQDIAHFAGDNKKKKLKKIPGMRTESFKESMNELLGLIYRSIVRADEDRKLYAELEKNKIEEENLEDDKRNQALIEALTGRKKTRTQKKAERRKERKQEKKEEVEEPKVVTKPTTTTTTIPEKVTEAPYKSLVKRSITPTATKVGAGAAIVGAASGGILVGSIKDVIAKEEGVATKAYWDPKGQKEKVSIGYGHQITKEEYNQGFLQIGDEQVPIKGERGIDTKISKEQAKTLLEIDLPRYQKRASDPLGSSWNKLNDDQKTALVSYAYNVGSTSNLVKAGLKDAIDSGDMQLAAKIIREKGIKTANGVYNKVLDERRQREASLFERTPTLQKVANVPTQTGNTIDTKSKENKDLKKETESPMSVDKIVNNTNVMNQSALNNIKREKEDDSNAYIKKVMLG
jgi:GH24 family phage-related lysozyme (muramidase)